MIAQPEKSGSVYQPATLVDLLRLRADSKAGGTAYIFLGDDLVQQASLTYGELDRHARAVAVALQHRIGPGERVLLLLPPGLDYIVAFYGCLYAYAVAVPAYPGRSRRKLARAESAAIDSKASLVLTADKIQAPIRSILKDGPGLQALQWLTVEEALTADENAWREPDVHADSLAFLQYTSGSTSSPRGVMVTHRNLLANEEFIQRAFKQDEESIIVGWLPLYHDMGLIGNVVQPLYLGAKCILMSPASFLQRPLLWLQAISHYRATTSGGPNFAYDLCVRTINADSRKALDLSSWTLAFNGAEPVRPQTMEKFSETFASCGFKRESFYPCYGLAEATLLVSAGPYFRQGRPAVKTLAAEDLERHQVRATDATAGRQIVSCGPIDSSQEIRIADPETRAELPEGAVGEIWLAGPSVALGYWNRPNETEECFFARLARGRTGAFLRTGDLGFVHEGELFVTGRIKDLIIIRGLNHYPQDIELTAQQADTNCTSGSTAAFSIPLKGEERLVVVQEAGRHWKTEFEEVCVRIRGAVAENHELHVYAIVLVKSGTIPKTSSGKVRRYAARELFLEGSLAEVFRDVKEDEIEWTTTAATPQSLVHTPPGERAHAVHEYLLALIARTIHPVPETIDSRRTLASLGLDSLAAVELRNKIEQDLGVGLPINEFLGDETIARLEQQILDRLESAEPAAWPPHSDEHEDRQVEHTVSYVQRALWFIQQMAPESSAYNLAFALRLLPQADSKALRVALVALLQRHPSLRTIFTSRDGEPVRQELPNAELSFAIKDATGLTHAELTEWLQAEAYQPFDLERGPVFKSVLFKDAAGGDVLLLVVHHIVFDGWSLWVLLDELATLYEDGLRGEVTDLPEIAATYNSFVRRQSEMMAGAEGERLLNYWRRELEGQLPVLDLPTFRPRPPLQTFNGASHAFDIGSQSLDQLKTLARAEGTTLYTILLAVFQVLLYRYTDQEDFVVGSPTSSRGRGEFDQVVGCFFNAVVLRARLNGNLTFREHLKRVRTSVLGALAHQEYPSHLLPEQLATTRDDSRPPLFQVSFIFQRPHRLHRAVSVQAAGLVKQDTGFSLRLLALERCYVRTDLELEMLDTGAGLAGAFHYNTDLFDAAFISRMSTHFLNLLSNAITNPTRSIDRLQLISESEAEIFLGPWSGSENAQPKSTYIVERIAQQAASHPSQVAAFKDDISLSYEQLEQRSNSLANLLRTLIK